MDRDDLYIAPTVVRNISLNDPVMQEEIFGPVLPILTFNKIDEALDIVNDREKPLALYVFSKQKKMVDYVRDNTSSGGFTANDTMTHAACNTLPFGGVGPSGIGGYHGKHSFEAFSHLKPCLKKYPGLEKLNDVRIAPYDKKKLSTVCWFLGYPTSLNSSHLYSKIIKFLGIGFFIAALAVLAKKYF
mmetsp:Transcript_8443/g.13457  ORF Transcript_8443/g.13457 Transcript_8443/m.13457 type:complete len:187 (-) Transcript_8443:39-599(-)